MNIDRHNYEEFFLLYVDNELNVDQKKQVEAFVLANPDLEEELVMLQQSKLVADKSIVYEGKENLMKTEGSSINMSNYVEWLLLYVDNELTTEEKTSVEKFAAAHPHVKAELELFQQAKLNPGEKIVFADKQSLYRTEERVRVIQLRWWRVAAAAILIIAAGLGGYSILSNKGEQEVIPTASIKTPKQSNTGSQQQKAIQNIPGKNPTAEIQPAKQVRPQPNETAKTEIKKQRPVKNMEETPKENLLATNTDSKREANLIVTTPRESSTTLTQSGTDFTANNAGDKQKFNNGAVTKIGEATPDLQTGTKSTPASEIVYAENDNKKIRGFFRKATRFIERTTKMNPANDDDKVLIGAMAISLK